MDEKEIKKELWHLSRLKKDTQKHTEARRQINGRIRELKKLKATAEVVEPEKQAVINEVLKVRKQQGNPVVTDLRKFTLAELQNHLRRITNESRKLNGVS